MLARLEELPGVARAATDRGGDVLLLTVRDDRAPAPAIDLLRALGYAAEPMAGVPVTLRWYDAASVGELSRAEADVIAERVVARAIAAGIEHVAGAPAVRTGLADALHACFLTTATGSGPSTGAFREDCVRAVVAALTPVVGGAVAEDVGRLVDADMREVHALTAIPEPPRP